MGHKESKDQPRINQIENGFYNIRASFKMLKGIVDIGTHMSIIALPDQKFVVIDAVPLDDKLKSEIDNLTDSGKNIVAVLATHPFHTLAFPSFYQAYPNPPYYGTPRHLRRLKDIPWAGDLNSDATRTLWAPHIELRIPAGAEFIFPEPESYNHFTCVWVYARDAKTIHVDDTVNYFDNPGTVMQLLGKKRGNMEFHDSMKGPGLYPTAEAPLLFKQWVEGVLADWDFENLCCAHLGNKLGGAKEALANTLAEAVPVLEKLSKLNAEKEAQAQAVQAQAQAQAQEEAQGKGQGEEVEWKVESEDCAKFNVDGYECG